MYYYFKDNYINNLLKEEPMTKNFQETFDNVTKIILDRVGKRKQYLMYVFEYNNIQFSIKYNRNYNINGLIRQMLIELHKKVHFYRHSNVSNEDDFQRFLQRFNSYSIDGETIKLNFNPVDDSWKENLKHDLESYIVHDFQVNKHLKEIEPDFTNYMKKEPNKEPDMESLNRYIDILLKYSKELQLDKFYRVSIGYYYAGSFGVSSSNILGHPEMIKSELNKIINIALKHSSDVIEVIPDGIREILDGKDIERIDFLSFKTVLNDNAIAVKKYLDEERAKGIIAYYESKPSGSYVGD